MPVTTKSGGGKKPTIIAQVLLEPTLPAMVTEISRAAVQRLQKAPFSSCCFLVRVLRELRRQRAGDEKGL